MKQIFIFFGLIIYIFSLEGCSHAVDPEERPVKDPRTYTWTIDTLYLPGSFQTMMTSIWGTSPKDIYVTGHNSDPWGDMYHYDGTKWTEVNLRPQHGGYIDDYIEMWGMTGFAANNIWAVGNGGELTGDLIIHYDGIKWTKMTFPYSKMGDHLTCVSGNNANDVWVGAWGTNYTFHYDGAIWRKDSLPVINPPHLGASFDEFGLNSIAADRNGNVYAIGIYWGNLPPYQSIDYYFAWKNAKWNIVDSAILRSGYVEIKWGDQKLWRSPSNTLYSVGASIYVWKDEKWAFLYRPPSQQNAVAGTSDKNIFVVGALGLVLHFNGTDWYTLPVFNDKDVCYTDVWTDGTEVFIVGSINSYPMKSVVIHGK